MRLPVTITNANKFGKVTNKWWVKVGKGPYRGFTQEEWARDGVAWINAALEGK